MTAMNVAMDDGKVVEYLEKKYPDLRFGSNPHNVRIQFNEPSPKGVEVEVTVKVLLKDTEVAALFDTARLN